MTKCKKQQILILIEKLNSQRFQIKLVLFQTREGSHIAGSESRNQSAEVTLYKSAKLFR